MFPRRDGKLGQSWHMNKKIIFQKFLFLILFHLLNRTYLDPQLCPLIFQNFEIIVINFEIPKIYNTCITEYFGKLSAFQFRQQGFGGIALRSLKVQKPQRLRQ